MVWQRLVCGIPTRSNGNGRLPARHCTFRRHRLGCRAMHFGHGDFVHAIHRAGWDRGRHLDRRAAGLCSLGRHPDRRRAGGYRSRWLGSRD